MPGPGTVKLPGAIFRQYDIRGTVGDQLTPAAARAVGQAYATLAWERLRRAPRVAVGRDNRPSGPALAAGVREGIVAAGGTAVDVGELPTPALYFATKTIDVDGGVQITGSHNPPEFNGFKMVLVHEAVFGDDIQRLRAMIEEGRLRREVFTNGRYFDNIIFGMTAEEFAAKHPYYLHGQAQAEPMDQPYAPVEG